jgi:GTPase SAR1 family protein
MAPSTQASNDPRRSMTATESGVHIVGKEVQVLVNAIEDFRAFGVEHVVQLPELVLVGDQSAGKSSLMGALTEIQLPRSTGICTRCPAHIKTTDSDEWICKISLHQTYKYAPQNGQKLMERDVTKKRPFPPWEEQPLEITPFKTIGDKRELEEVLRWAQVAILNDSHDHARYVPGTAAFANDSRTEAKFSPNVVSVEISGPRLPSLSFYDLPGIFSNAAKEDGYLIKVIENLTKKYIRHSQALIICAITMCNDPRTSRTVKVISDCNAEGRCIGVLTMADRLQDGVEHKEFEQMLRGDFEFRHGYFATKLPAGQSSGTYDPMYHENARNEEERFFNTAEPWSSVWKDFRGRCGTTSLQQALSQKFASQIKGS